MFRGISYSYCALQIRVGRPGEWLDIVSNSAGHAQAKP